MLPPARSILLILLLAALSLSGASAQTPAKQSTASISGRVLFQEKGLANIIMAVYPAERFGPERTMLASAKTDFEGRYRLSNLPAGRYTVVAVAPVMIGPTDGQFGETGKAVTLADGEAVDKIDFSLVKGGVITGRVTDADGMPVIGERVQLTAADTPNRRPSFSTFDPFMYQTDDRGIYRIYGVAPGRYKLSVGEAAESGSMRFGFSGRGYYVRTFHPNVTDETRATIIEVGTGSEVSNVDISVGRKAQTFAASGRVVDESGQPVPNVRIGYGTVLKDNRMGGFGITANSDEKGQFRLDGMVPGRYAVFVFNEVSSDAYSEPLQFEVSEGDITGLEVKYRRGASINGVAVIEGTADPAVLAKMPQLSIMTGPTQPTNTLSAPNFSNTRLSADGSFHIGGLRPGKYRIFIAGFPQPVAGFRLARVEREGVPQTEIEVGAGAQINNIRLVLEYGTGRVSGLVRIEGTPPEGMRLGVEARRVGEPITSAPRTTQVDARGRFLLEGIPAGDYEIIVRVFLMNDRRRRFRPAKQVVTVTNGIEAEVTLTLNLDEMGEEGNQP